MAASCAHNGQTRQAIDYLRLSISEGFASAKKISSDPEFAPLRGIPEFESLLRDSKTQ